MVPFQQGADRPAAPSPGTPARLWVRTAWRSALVPLIVLSPLAALAPAADHRFNVYQAGGLYGRNPLRIVPDSMHEVTTYLRLGNFRPLGRMVEKSLDLAAYLLGDLFGLPTNVALRLVSFGSAVLLTFLAVLFAESVLARGPLFGGPPSTLAALVPFGVGGAFVAAGVTSTTVLFGALYLLTTALVLAVSVLACRVVAPGRRRLGWWRGLLAVVLGAGIAAFNELAYLAVPLVTAAVLIRGRWVVGLSWRRTVTGPGARSVALIWLGFLPIAGTVREIIHGYCTVRSCYRGSDPAVGGAVVETVPARMLSWLPPLGWQQALYDNHRPWLLGLLPALALVALAFLAWRTARDLPLLSTVDRRQALAVAGAALVLLAAAAGMAALNADVQSSVAAGRWGLGWRDSGATAVAGTLVLLGLCHAAVVRPAARRRLAPVLLALLVVTAVVTVAANRRFDDIVAQRATSELDNRIAVEVTDFDTSAAGNARRCALLQEALTRYADSPTSRRRYPQTLDLVAHRKSGHPFCLPAGR
jgi:hypothetical protein